jgi:hypothetical protein
MTEGEAFVYSGGGVGVFGEVGVPEAALKENKWTRIVITMGGAPTTFTQTRGRTAGRFGRQYDDRFEEAAEFGEASYRFVPLSCSC